MNEHITHVAMDDSKRTIVIGILKPGAEAPEMRLIPNERRLFERLQREGRVTACYEAGSSGYDLYRQLTAFAVPCQVMAPALTPRKPGDRVKTDRRDASKLVCLFRAGELTPIRVPDEAGEAVRDLVRCREDVQKDLRRWQHRLQKVLARHGWVPGRAPLGVAAVPALFHRGARPHLPGVPGHRRTTRASAGRLRPGDRRPGRHGPVPPARGLAALLSGASTRSRP